MLTKYGELFYKSYIRNLGSNESDDPHDDFNRKKIIGCDVK